MEDRNLLWNRLLAALPPTRRAIFREGQLVGWEGEEVRVAFAKSFLYERALALREEVEGMAQALLGERVRVVPLPPSPPGVSRGVSSSDSQGKGRGSGRGQRGRKGAWLEKARLLGDEEQARLREILRGFKPLGGELVLLRLPKVEAPTGTAEEEPLPVEGE